jgi:NDP-sugar pyrophosphorylase family protein
MGDHLTNIDIRALVNYHKKSKTIATVALQKNKIALEYGIARVENGIVVEFVEKPVIEHFVNTAIYAFEPRIFDYIKEKDDFAKDVFPRLLKEGVNISAYLFDDVWFDVGRVSDYERLNELFKMMNLFNTFR